MLYLEKERIFPVQLFYVECLASKSFKWSPKNNIDLYYL